MLSNYPDGLSDWTPGAPWNEPEVPEKEFEITCSQSLSRTVGVWTNNYIPGASGVDYESDGEGGYIAEGWHDDDDTSDTNWSEEYEESGYKTPLQLIQMLKEYLQKDLKKWEEEDRKTPNSGLAFQVGRFKHLIEECDCWTEDDIEFIEG